MSNFGKTLDFDLFFNKSVFVDREMFIRSTSTPQSPLHFSFVFDVFQDKEKKCKRKKNSVSVEQFFTIRM